MANEEKYIPFMVIYRDSSDGLYSSGFSVAKKNCHNLLDKKHMALKKKSIKVLFSYPLSNPQVFTLSAPNKKYFTKEDLAMEIAKIYQHIYKEEAKTSNQKVLTIEERKKKGALMNRNRTDGIYGIYGHDITDLSLSGMKYNKEKKYYILYVDS